MPQIVHRSEHDLHLRYIALALHWNFAFASHGWIDYWHVIVWGCCSVFQVAKAVSHSLNNCVNCLPGQKDVDMALRSIGEASKKLLVDIVSQFCTFRFVKIWCIHCLPSRYFELSVIFSTYIYILYIEEISTLCHRRWEN